MLQLLTGALAQQLRHHAIATAVQYLHRQVLVGLVALQAVGGGQIGRHGNQPAQWPMKAQGRLVDHGAALGKTGQQDTSTVDALG